MIQDRQVSDDEIIRRIRNGDLNAFEWIVKRYESSVANVIYGILGNDPRADDLGQEVFMRAFRGIKNFGHRAQFKTYLTRIAINVCRDAIRKKERRMMTYEEEAPHLNPLVFDQQEELDAKDLVHTALFQLESEQRAVVVMRIMEGYSTKETATLLKIPEGTVLSRLSRGLGKLRQILKKELLIIDSESNG